VSDESRPPLRRVHTDRTLSTGSNRFSLEYWQRRKTEEIVKSLRPGKAECLKVKPDGRILNGNIRVKVLEDRGFDVNSLEREVV
jgi:hypothetical protein